AHRGDEFAFAFRIDAIDLPGFAASPEIPLTIECNALGMVDPGGEDFKRLDWDDGGHTINVLHVVPGQWAINEPPDFARILIAQFRWERVVGKILEAYRPGKTFYGHGADRSKMRAGGGWIGAAVMHGRANFDAGGKAIEDEASGLLLEN